MAKRSIFTDVEETEKPKPQTGLIDQAARFGDRFAVRVWLGGLFALVVIMIAVGGLTRLTDSGLSITEWRPIMGALPPLTADDWQSEFELYKQIPEYQLQNQGMSLEAFKVIYWWEWGHRQLGRLIGLVWALGFAWLALTRRIPAGWTGRLFLLGVLGGLQGAIGWWMVSSGLTGDRLDVASYRLAVHLGLAFLILGLIAWFMMALLRSDAELITARRGTDINLKRLSIGVLIVLSAQILTGALVAGIDAGRSYTDWPLMSGQFLPPDPFYIEPVLRNFFENAGLVQFIHRMLGYTVLVFAIYIWLQRKKSGNAATRHAVHAFMAMILIQVALGIVTLIYAAPWSLAILHQFGAVVLVVLCLRILHLSIYPMRQRVSA